MGGGFLEQVGAVGEGDRGALPRFHHEGEGVVGGVGRGDPGQAHGLFQFVGLVGVLGGVAQDVEGVEEGAQSGLSLDVGEVDVVEGQQVGLLSVNTCEQVDEVFGRVWVDPHRDGVEEQADDRGDFRDLRWASGDGAAEDDVVAAGLGAQGQRPGGAEEGVGGDADFAGHGGERFGGRRGQFGLDRAWHDRAASRVGWGHEGGCVEPGQGVAPGVRGQFRVLLGEPDQVVAVGPGGW